MTIVTKLTFDLFDEETGRKYQRYLDTENAKLWQEYMVHVCKAAPDENYPQWHLLRWVEVDIQNEGEDDDIHPVFSETKLEKKKLPKNDKNK